MQYRKLLAKKISHVIVFVQCIFILLEVFSFFGLSGVMNNYQDTVAEQASMSKVVAETTFIAQDYQENLASRAIWNENANKILSSLKEYRLYSVKTANTNLKNEVNNLIEQFNQVNTEITATGSSEDTSLFGENLNAISSYISTSMAKEQSKNANLLFITAGFLILGGLLVVFAHIYCFFGLFAPVPARAYKYSHPPSEIPLEYTVEQETVIKEEPTLSTEESSDNDPEIDYSQTEEEINAA